VKLIDAAFIWTEPHSKRIKVKLTIQKEAFTDVVLQQVFAVELKVENYHCTNCHKVAAKDTWEAVVQLRQRVDHKRTFYLLEQMILKHGVHGSVSNVKEVPDGIDFYFIEKRHAQKLINFVTGMVPCRVKTGGERVISEDFTNNSVKQNKASSLEIVPICKDDLVVLHPKQHSALGCIGTTAYMSYLHMRPHTTIYVCSYYYRSFSPGRCGWRHAASAGSSKRIGSRATR
jgi:nonsense-mediated mRNA decay protein 3